MRFNNKEEYLQLKLTLISPSDVLHMQVEFLEDCQINRVKCAINWQTTTVQLINYLQRTKYKEHLFTTTILF